MESEMDSKMDRIFAKDIFRSIPAEVKKILSDSGFESLVSLITLTVDDISEMDTSTNSKLFFIYFKINKKQQ